MEGREDFLPLLTFGVCDLSQCFTGLFMSRILSPLQDLLLVLPELTLKGT